MFDELKALLPFSTKRQRECVEALIETGATQKASEKLGISPGRVRSHISELKKSAERRGWAPGFDMNKAVPEHFHVKGVSTLYNADGVVTAQWVKSQANSDEKTLDLLREAVLSLSEPIAGQSLVFDGPETTNKDLLCVYPMGDPHIGMFAWAKETGQDFDLKIAEEELVAAVDDLVDSAPPSETAIVAPMGDYFHSDNYDNKTARSGHPLDVDTRWPKVVSVGLRAMKRCIDRALEKHTSVHVECVLGNHDSNGSLMMALMLNEYYSNNDRVFVSTNPGIYRYYRFHNNLLGFTHGHKAKPEKLPAIMAVDRKEDWGETEFRHFYCGHLHHDRVREYPGCTVETLRTLAPKDAWHFESGYRSLQDMKVDVWHKEFGFDRRHVVSSKRIKARLSR